MDERRKRWAEERSGLRPGPPPGLRFGLLGAPAVFDAAGEPQPVRSAKGRALLAALLLEPDKAVSLGALEDALWGDAPPPSARASLQNHVTRLRRLLDDPERLRAVPPGYRLRVGEGELDVRVFERRVTRARAAHAERDWARAASEAGAALALWRGEPLSGLTGPLADHPLLPRVREARLLALEWRYDAALGLGTGLAALAPELTALVARHPLREAFHRQLMLALHRTGRQAEALAVHRELRGRLLDELGVEPGPPVREAHTEVLRTRAGGAGTPGLRPAPPPPTRPSASPASEAPGADTPGRVRGAGTAEPVSGVDASVPASGGTAAVPVPGCAAAVSVSGAGAAEPVSGVDASVPASGGTAAVPVPGCAAAVSVSGAGAAEPVSGVDASVPASGGTAAVPVPGCAAAVSVSGAGAAVPVSGAADSVPASGVGAAPADVVGAAPTTAAASASGAADAGSASAAAGDASAPDPADAAPVRGAAEAAPAPAAAETAAASASDA
ncbi:BTAD domain-containing putative transcriptional regulator, partial [Streptomyces flavofungini]|uniref:AfsR/SARP family transcriptional regulator n=1 Tax=Streptomyces flavofungini TaxID=68200 RepID=UPI003F7E3CAE